MHHLGILLKYRSWFSRPGLGSEIANKLSGGAHATGLQATLWTVKFF